MKAFHLFSISFILLASSSSILPQCTSPSLLGDCVNTVKYESTSPDGMFIATAFERGCGATTDFNMQASVRESSQPFDFKSGGNILVIGGRDNIHLNWINKRHLSIRFSAAKIFKKEKTWRSINITYND
jgi:hypothetical protein